MARPIVPIRVLTLVATALLAVAVGAGPAVAGAGGGGGGGGSPCAGFGSGDELVLRDNCIEGTGHVVTTGTTVTVVNEGRQPHDLTAVDGSFGSGPMAPDDTYEITFDEPGVIEVRCTLHSSREGHGMAGLLVVTDGDGMVPAAAASGPGGSGRWALVAAGVVLLGTVAARRLTGWLARRDDDPSAEPTGA